MPRSDEGRMEELRAEVANYFDGDTIIEISELVDLPKKKNAL